MKLKKRNKIIKNRLLKDNRVNYDSLNSLIKNIYYVKGGDFREEAMIIKEVLDVFILHGKFDEARDFFIYDILRIDNKNSFANLISVLYKLRAKYAKNLNIIRFLQNLLYELLISEFEKKKGFNKKLNTGGLYLKEFLSIIYEDKFKNEINKRWLEQYKFLIDNTIKSLGGVCKFIISLADLEVNLKKMYLESYLSDLNKSLHYNRTLTIYDFPDSNDEELKDFKIDLIGEKIQLLKESKLSLLFLILYNIDQAKLPKSFFETAYKLYQLGDLISDLNETFDPLLFPDLEWLTYDSFKGGAQTIPRFNYDRYRLLILFYNYIHNQNKETGIKNLTKENFTGSISNLEEELKKFEKEFVERYFNFSEKEFNSFKKNALKDVKEKKKDVKNLEEKYIQDSKIKEEYVAQFEKNCRKIWEEKQKELSEILVIKKEEKENKKKLFFGQNKLFPKEWFLDSFDKHVGLSRTNGGDFGRDQTESKYRLILEEINFMFGKSEEDKEIIINDLYSDLSKNIENGKIYYLFYTGREIYDLPNIEWLRKDIFVAKLKIRGAEIYFCHSRIPETLLFEKQAFTLKQYLNNKKEELTINIEEEFSEEEINKILKSSKNLKTKGEVLKYVKIKVLEKFEIERTKGHKLIRLII